jgi:hypothetical protein
MNTSELIHAAAAIAGPIAAQSFNAGAMSEPTIERIAKTAVVIALAIEEQARHGYGKGPPPLRAP